MIDWRTGRLIVLILLLLAVVVGAGLATQWQRETEASGRADLPVWVRFLDWWREEPVMEPEVIARPAQLPQFPVVVIPPNPVPPFVPRPEELIPVDPSFLEQANGLVYCPPGPANSSSPWCA